MNEGTPEGPDSVPAPIESAEHITATYEHALGAIASLREAGVVDPYNTDDAQVDAAFDTLMEWKRSHALEVRNIDSAEKAENTVRLARIFLDAGYGGQLFVRRALRQLYTAYADMINKNDLHLDPSEIDSPENDEAIKEILSAAIAPLEEELGALDPKERVEGAVLDRIDEAKEKAKNGDPTDAVRLIVSTIHHPEYKRYYAKHPQKLEYLKRLRLAAMNVKNGGDPAEIDGVLE